MGMSFLSWCYSRRALSIISDNPVNFLQAERMPIYVSGIYVNLLVMVYVVIYDYS